MGGIFKVRFVKECPQYKYGLKQYTIPEGTEGHCIGASFLISADEGIVPLAMVIVSLEPFIFAGVGLEYIEAVPLPDRVYTDDLHQEVLEQMAVAVDMAIEAYEMKLGKLSRFGRLMDEAEAKKKDKSKSSE